MSKKRRKFSDEFRREAVRLAVDGKRSVTSVASELGIYQSTLSRWIGQEAIDSGRAVRLAVGDAHRVERSSGA